RRRKAADVHRLPRLRGLRSSVYPGKDKAVVPVAESGGRRLCQPGRYCEAARPGESRRPVQIFRSFVQEGDGRRTWSVRQQNSAGWAREFWARGRRGGTSEAVDAALGNSPSERAAIWRIDPMQTQIVAAMLLGFALLPSTASATTLNQLLGWCGSG